MSLQDYSFLPRYKTDSNDFITEFFVPVLTDAIRYDRAVGYFSSTALVSISRGLFSLLENDGKVRIIASPELSKEDYEAIAAGYRSKEEVTIKALLDALKSSEEDEQIDRLNLIAKLISSGKCDIKIAMIKEGVGIYHEKIGVVEDADHNRVVFSGSLNETASALESNYESILVSCSWNGGGQIVDLLDSDFQELWDNKSKYVEVTKFDVLDEAVIKKYLRKDRKLVNRDLITVEEYPRIPDTYGPVMSEWLKLHPYQKDAVETFVKQDGCGIFDMATGTGKTLTALAAMTAISHQLDNKLGVVIVVPYKHLIPQWVKDITSFGITDVVACSSDYKNWQDLLDSAMMKSVFMKRFFCCITTVSTFCDDSPCKINTLQNIISRYGAKTLMLIGDEAHNLGAPKAKSVLEKCKFTYKLALSATLKRHHDDEGTIFLDSYFGKKCIEYDLKRAIDEKFLTPYEYYPIFVSMNQEERDLYTELTAKIGKALCGADETTAQLPKAAQTYMIARSRLVANVSSKLGALAKAIKPFKDESNILIYCGASATIMDDYSSDKEPLDQIDAVVELVSSLKMSVKRFTSKENATERKEAIDFFSKEKIQTLVAIKCLDEGVNITGINRAFILASTTNPKEYIQRRGRVLRLAKNKDKAYIYDFIVLPYDIDACKNLPKDQKQTFKRLVFNEMSRFKEFASLCANNILNLADLTTICSYFDINSNKLSDAEVSHGENE